MEPLNIGLLRGTLNSGNMGCNALSYSAILLLKEVAELLNTPAEYTCFTSFSPESIALYPQLLDQKIQPVGAHIMLKSQLRLLLKRQPDIIRKFKDGFNDCGLYLEIAGGDSFSDIYGINRLEEQYAYHKAIQKKKKPVAFLPQTIGPFKSKKAKMIAKECLSYADRIFVRDPLSFEVCSQYVPTGKIMQTIDMAFFMDYVKRENVGNGRIQVGLNPSGLLWNGGYTANNQFGLKEDYRRVIRSTIETLEKAGVEPVLVSHVLGGPQHVVEDDYKVCRLLQQEFPFCKIAPFFYSPVEAKSFISGLDLVVGSRMHCCIAAYSSGVPVYPLGYSRKFTGLFRKELNWSHGSDLVSDSMGDTLEGLRNVLDNLESVQKEMPKRVDVVNAYKQPLIDGLKSVVSSVTKRG